MPAIYVGAGNYLDGIPARDLTDEEYDALTREQKRDVRRSGLYEMVEAEPEPEADASTDDTSKESSESEAA